MNSALRGVSTTHAPWGAVVKETARATSAIIKAVGSLSGEGKKEDKEESD